MTPVNGVPAAAEVAAPPGPPPEAESEVDAFRRQVDDLVSKTDVVILPCLAPIPCSSWALDIILRSPGNSGSFFTAEWPLGEFGESVMFSSEIRAQWSSDWISISWLCVQLERRVNEVVDFYDGKKHGSGGRKGGGGSRGHSRGMSDLMRQFGVIMREVSFLGLIL